ncbi:MAG: hypothetical protein J6X31_04985 [Bacteroidales bacterium]|nr:hypothetical protein [Bacteroidales bacterium]
MKSTLWSICCLAITLLPSCSTRDEAHITGTMSQHATLNQAQTCYSPYKEETWAQAQQVLSQIDSTTLSTRDYYEWLELKCNIAEANKQPCGWIEEVERWAQYADREGSDRDILAAHYHLCRAYRNWDPKVYEQKRRWTYQECDSLWTMGLQEALFCIYYKEDLPDYAPQGDFLLLKANAYAYLSKIYNRTRSVNYVKSGEYAELASQTLARYLRHFPHCSFRKEINKQRRDLLCQAALLYRNCVESDKASRCAFELLSLAVEEDIPEEVCLYKALQASIDVFFQFDSGQFDRYAEKHPETFVKYGQWAMPLLNECIRDYPKGKTVPSEVYLYKAMAHRLMGEMDSVYLYVQKADELEGDPLQKEALHLSALYKEQHGDKAGAAADYREAIRRLERVKNRLAQSHKSVPEEMAKRRTQEVIEGHQHRYEQSLWRLSGLFLLLLLTVVWFTTRKQRKMRQMRHDIDALNHQLDQLRADLYQRQVTVESLNEVPPCDNRMEEVFCQKMAIKKKAFTETSLYKTILDYNLRFSAASNPDAVALPAVERHLLMDGILTEFSVECQQLRELCPDLTATDAIYCILHLIGCGRELGTLSMEVSAEAYRRRKSRLKAKLSERLFALFFDKVM